MNKEFDIGIMGAGPAGCSTALALARLGYQCILIESSDYSNIRVGETLPAAVSRLLTQLGAWEQFQSADYAPALAVQSVWGRDQILERNAIFDPYGFGWHIDRGHFDRMLAERAEAIGVRIMRAARVDSATKTNSGGWQLEITSSGSRQVARARVLVDATGRRSSIARRLGAKRRRVDRLIGCVSFFRPNGHAIVEPQVMLVEAASDGWWYSAPLPDSRAVVVYMTDADIFAKVEGPMTSRLAKLIEGAPRTAEKLEHFDLDRGPSVFAASSSRLDQVWGDNWIAVGDSAMAFDPLSAQGVYRAMKSGVRAAQAISGFYSTDTTGLDAYAAELSSEFDRYMRQRQYHYLAEMRWVSNDFWHRRHAPALTLRSSPGCLV